MKVMFEFDNEGMAYHFFSWLSGAGEQDYWLWMEVRESQGEAAPEETAYHFNFDGKNAKATRGKI